MFSRESPTPQTDQILSWLDEISPRVTLLTLGHGNHSISQTIISGWIGVSKGGKKKKSEIGNHRCILASCWWWRHSMSYTWKWHRRQMVLDASKSTGTSWEIGVRPSLDDLRDVIHMILGWTWSPRALNLCRSFDRWWDLGLTKLSPGSSRRLWIWTCLFTKPI